MSTEEWINIVCISYDVPEDKRDSLIGQFLQQKGLVPLPRLKTQYKAIGVYKEEFETFLKERYERENRHIS